MPRCPACYIPMTRTEEEGVRAHVCGSCFGTWLPPVALLRRVRLDVANAQPSPQAGAASSTGASDSAAGTQAAAAELPLLTDLVDIVAEADNKKPLRCPECEKPMLKDRFQQMIPVSIDRCRHCDRIWLDTGKYNLIRRLYVEMVLSTDPQIVQLREKIAHANVAWEGRATMKDSLTNAVSSSSDVGGFSLNVLLNILAR